VPVKAIATHGHEQVGRADLARIGTDSADQDVWRTLQALAFGRFDHIL
jgi:hypothetical protein